MRLTTRLAHACFATALVVAGCGGGEIGAPGRSAGSGGTAAGGASGGNSSGGGSCSCAGKTCGAADDCGGTCCAGSGCTPVTCSACQDLNSCGSACTNAAAAGSPGSPSCAPYVCDGSSDTCPTSCTSSASCVAGDLCDNSVCFGNHTILDAAHRLNIPPSVDFDALQIWDQILIISGYLPATIAPYAADPTGANDSTAAIQNAMNDARDYALTTYLPAGTYTISNTLDGLQQWTPWSFQTLYGYDTAYGTSPQAPSLVGPTSGPPAIIVLANSSAGFNDPANPKPMLYMHNDGMYSGGTYVDAQCGKNYGSIIGCFDNFMFAVVRDLEFVVGNDNSGAIGVRFYSAQYSYMENVTVDATNGYAGLEGAPATNMWTNIAVTGGQYGIWVNGGGGTNTFAGVTLKNQTTAGFYIASFVGANMLVGFDIEPAAGAPAVLLPDTVYSEQMLSLSLFDGYAESSGAQPAIDSPTGANLYLDNVYAKASSVLVRSGGATALAASGNVDLINEFSHTESANSGNGPQVVPLTSYNVIDGTMGQQDVVSIQANVGTPPSDLVSRHTPGQVPWINDAGVVYVTDAPYNADPTGQTDSTAAIQAAVNASDNVFLPRGDYVISGTIELKPNTRLFGVPGDRSRIMASPNWFPNGQFMPFVRTADSATGKTFVGDLYLFLDTSTTSLDQTYLIALEWQTGRSSIQNQVTVLPEYTETDISAVARNLVHVVNNGGGRWFGPQLESISNHSHTNNPDARMLFVDHTQTPLTLYGSNPEHGMGTAMYKISGASNVRILGLKFEADGLMDIYDSSNITLAGLDGNYSPQISISPPTGPVNLCIIDYGWYSSKYEDPTGVPNIIYGTTTYPLQYGYSLFKVGTCATAKSYPYCGDSMCDGAEAHPNCPIDCP